MQSSRRQILEDTFIGASPRAIGGPTPPAAVGSRANRGRGGEDGWRGPQTLVALVLVAIGLVLVVGAAWALAARALPLSWLPGRPAAQSGIGLALLGLALGSIRGRSGR
jgi:hypothetical protein